MRAVARHRRREGVDAFADFLHLLLAPGLHHIGRGCLRSEQAGAHHDDFQIGSRPLTAVEGVDRELDEELVWRDVALQSGVFQAFPVFGFDADVL